MKKKMSIVGGSPGSLVRDERVLFERWISTWKPTPPSLKRTGKSGRYDDVDVWMAWLAWKASARASR